MPPAAGLSALQRIWVIDEQKHGGPMRPAFASFRIAGPLRVDLFDRALAQARRRHRVLRPRRETGTDGAVRVRLARLDRRLHELKIEADPVVCDAASARLLAIEITELYRQLASAAPAAPSRLEYRTGGRQRRRLAAGARERDLAYWRERFDGMPAHALGWGDRRASAAPSDRARAVPFAIPPAVSARARELATRAGVDLQAVMLAAFIVVLMRHGEKEGLRVGVTVPGRAANDEETVVGCLTNHVMLEAAVPADVPFADLLEQVSADHARAAEHAELPLLSVLRQATPRSGEGRRRAASHQDLFRVVFSMCTARPVRRRFCGLTLTQTAGGEALLSCDLAMRLWPARNRIEGELVYADRVFTRPLADAVSRHFVNAVKSCAAAPETQVDRLALSEAAERRRVTASARGRKRGASNRTLLHALVEAQVKRTPRACAVVHRGGRLTYRELDERATRLAARLRRHGVGPETVVAICLEPGVEVPVAILGVLKAGGGYMPIAVTTPMERIGRILAASGAQVLIAHEHGRYAGVPCRVLGPDGTGDEDSAGPEAARARPTPDHLAYVIHTSGSTGEPKGVMVPHRGICNTLRWRQARLPLTASDRVLLTFSFSFDASLFQLFQPLIAGARLVIPDMETGGDPARLVEEIRRHRITVLGAVPSLLKLLVARRNLGGCSTLRVVFCGGEPLSEELAEAVRSRLGVELHNMYGPTEASMETTWRTVLAGARVSIGHPVDNVGAYVLDDALEPVAVGVPGELYVGGAGVARGYLALPGATAERFVPDPFAGTSGARMYRTGDVCRWLPDAGLDFLGRRDEQVKLRGHRIELGEIEAALGTSPAVRENAVVLRRDERGEDRLVAYVVMHDDVRDGVQALRRHLYGRLPRYMVPSELVSLEMLPRGANGKVDRRVLPSPRRPAARRSRAKRARRPLERYLAGVWGEVLGLEAVDDRDDFFELGGDSIRVAVVAHRLEAALGEYVYTVALYDAPTVAQLAGYLRENYPDAVRRLVPDDEVAPTGRRAQVDRAAVAELRRLIRPLADRRGGASLAKNAPAAFILSPPRAGSTLFRVMLGAHPRVFAPPELQLLNYNTLRERRAALSSERDAFWLQGTVRAVMELRHCSALDAAALIEDCERRDLSVKEFYGVLQDGLRGRLLVDKTPTYSLDPATLRRAEEDFDGARYIHLVRSPAASIASFEEAKLHVFFPPFLSGPHRFTCAQLAELVWDVSHQNILAFLERIPPERQLSVRFEELVQDPRRVATQVSRFLGLRFSRKMIEPYKQDQRRLMTDAPHPMGRMLGDVKFHRHGRIRAGAGRNRGRDHERLLGPVTRELAGRLGYELRPAQARALVAMKPGGMQAPLFLVHPAGGSVSCYGGLARRLGSRWPVYAFQSLALEGGSPLPRSIGRLAGSYLDELAGVQARGPYTLGGWSFGGLVAVEMALQLWAAGEEVWRVILLDSHLGVPGAAYGRLGTRQFVGDFLRERGLDPGALPAASSPPAQLMRQAFEQARRAGVVPAGLDLADFKRVLERHERVYRAHVRLARRYMPRGDVDRLVLLEPSDARRDGRGPFGNWASVTEELVRRTVPGDHFTMLHEPGVRDVARTVRELMEPATATRTRLTRAATKR
jgi:amino acid adenylation domain-containing protein